MWEDPEREGMESTPAGESAPSASADRPDSDSPAAPEVEAGAPASEAEAKIPAEPEQPAAKPEEPAAEAGGSPPEAEEQTPAEAEQSAAEPEEKAAESDEPPAEPAEPDDDRAWYVVHCYSGQENKVRHNLEQRIETMNMKDQIFDIIIPTIEEIEVKDGKRRTVEKRVYPGYLMVQMILTEESWFVVRNTPGVTGFVGMGNTPTPLRPEEVAQILRRMETTTPTV